MKPIAIVVFAWWFLWYSLGHPTGPFRDKIDCEQVRNHMAINKLVNWKRVNEFASWCWWDGKD